MKTYGHPVTGRAYTAEEASRFIHAFESRDFDREEIQTTQVTGTKWAARSAPIPLDFTATRSANGRDAFQIRIPQATEVLQAGRNPLPILRDCNTRAQVGVVEVNKDGTALARFSRSLDGTQAMKAFVRGEVTGEVAYLQQGATQEPAALSLRTSLSENQTLSDATKKEFTTMSDAQDIALLGEKYGRSDLAVKAIAAGTSLQDFRGQILDANSTQPVGRSAPAYHSGTERSFSLSKLILAEATNDWSDAGYEREMSQQARAEYKGQARGIVVPASAVYSQRATMLTSGNAAGSVATVLDGNQYIDALRPVSAVVAAGATMLPGLSANTNIPRNNSDLSAAWVEEGGSITESGIDVGTVSLTPKMLAGRASFSRHLLATSTPAIDQLVRSSLTMQIANGLDDAALEGSGLGATPTGVSNQSGINTFATAGGSTMTHAESLDALAEIAAANLDTTNAVWILNPLDAAKLGAQSKDSGSGSFVYESGTILGRRVIESTHATQGTAYVGLWENCLIGVWGGLDLVIDPFSSADTGSIRIIASQLSDVAVRHPLAFQKITLTA